MAAACAHAAADVRYSGTPRSPGEMRDKSCGCGALEVSHGDEGRRSGLQGAEERRVRDGVLERQGRRGDVAPRREVGGVARGEGGGGEGQHARDSSLLR